MDGLALLCNLHADGPLTLRRLRDAGVRTLRDVAGFPERTLSSWLGGQRARRFIDEARQLAARLAETALEPEEVPRSTPPTESIAAARRAARPEPRLSFHAESSGLGETTLHAVGLPGVELHGGCLGGLDAETCVRLSALGVRTYEALIEHANLTLARRAGIPYPKLLDLSAQARRFLTERAKEPALASRAPGRPGNLVSTPLRAGAIEGLDEETCRRLSVGGVRTFSALVEQTSLSLARRTGIPYPRLLDLSAEAQRFSTEQVELRAEPPRRGPSLEGLSTVSPARTARRSWSSPRMTEAPNRELAGLSEDPGIAGPFQ